MALRLVYHLSIGMPLFYSAQSLHVAKIIK